MEIRSGSVADLDAVIALFDEAVAWLVERGRSDQWGSEPFSAKDASVQFARTLIEQGELYVAELDGAVVGASILNRAPMTYVPAIEVPELYLRLLISSRAFKGRRIGSRLIEHAREEAQRRGIELIRVDCYASADEALIGYYESQGFVRSERIEVKPGVSVQVFEMRVDLQDERESSDYL